MYNAYIVAPLATWAVAQVLKFAITAFKGRIDFRKLYASGGMPSVHSAVVCSLATTAFLVDGPSSHLFGFTAIFAVIVMYDSLGVRRAAGEQAVALNLLIAEARKSRPVGQKPLREVLGHTPTEVLSGAALGVILAMVFAYDRLSGLTNFLTASPRQPEYIAFGIVGIVLILVGLLLRFGLPMVKKESTAVKKLSKSLFTIFETTGWITLLAALLEYERASYLAWRVWPVLALICGGIALIVITFRWATRLPEELALEAENRRKTKWFNWGSGRNKTKSKKA